LLIHDWRVPLKITFALAILATLSILTFARFTTSRVQAPSNSLALPNEKHLRNLKQLTFGGENAEAYFSSDGKQLIFQSTRDRRGCDQIYSMNIDGSNVKMISNGDGRTTCSYIFPGGKRVLYSSTYLADKQCPPRPDFSQGYVWAVYPGFDIFTAKPDGTDIKQLTTAPGYDAETTITLDGKKLVFTSTRNGDLDIYTMDADGGNVKQLTNELGYDGGPFWSYDGKQIVYRAYHPETEKQKTDYTNLLKQNLIRPTTLEIWVMNADGSNKRQVTHNGKANFGPYFFPDGKRSSSRRTWMIQRGGILICIRSMSMDQVWKDLPLMRPSTAFRCLQRMERSWSLRRIEMLRSRATQTCSSQIGSSSVR
jgi:Tol biopolymer transport system component